MSLFSDGPPSPVDPSTPPSAIAPHLSPLSLRPNTVQNNGKMSSIGHNSSTHTPPSANHHHHHPDASSCEPPSTFDYDSDLLSPPSPLSQPGSFIPVTGKKSKRKSAASVSFAPSPVPDGDTTMIQIDRSASGSLSGIPTSSGPPHTPTLSTASSGVPNSPVVPAIEGFY